LRQTRVGVVSLSQVGHADPAPAHANPPPPSPRSSSSAHKFATFGLQISDALGGEEIERKLGGEEKGCCGERCGRNQRWGKVRKRAATGSTGTWRRGGAEVVDGEGERPKERRGTRAWRCLHERASVLVGEGYFWKADKYYNVTKVILQKLNVLYF
jgi:hypothetical protein